MMQFGGWKVVVLDYSVFFISCHADLPFLLMTCIILTIYGKSLRSERCMEGVHFQLSFEKKPI